MYIFFFFAAEVGFWPRRIFHQVPPVRGRSWRCVWDRWVYWRHPDTEEARPRGKGVLRPSGPGYQQEDQWARGTSVRVYHQGAGHQWQYPPVPEWAVWVQHPRDVSSRYVYKDEEKLDNVYWKLCSICSHTCSSVFAEPCLYWMAAVWLVDKFPLIVKYILSKKKFGMKITFSHRNIIALSICRLFILVFTGQPFKWPIKFCKFCFTHFSWLK